MPNQNEPQQLNHFQYFLRGVDAIKTAAATAASSVNSHSSTARMNSLFYAGTIQLSFAALTTIGLIGRVIENPRRLRTNLMGLLIRTGIVAIDVLSGILILSDPEEKTERSKIGLNLMACSIFASRLAGEDGHHNETTTPENKAESSPLLTSHSKQNYSSI